jgi:hypothetical protein
MLGLAWQPSGWPLRTSPLQGEELARSPTDVDCRVRPHPQGPLRVPPMRQPRLLPSEPPVPRDQRPELRRHGGQGATGVGRSERLAPLPRPATPWRATRKGEALRRRCCRDPAGVRDRRDKPAPSRTRLRRDLQPDSSDRPSTRPSHRLGKRERWRKVLRRICRVHRAARPSRLQVPRADELAARRVAHDDRVDEGGPVGRRARRPRLLREGGDAPEGVGSASVFEE